MEANTRTRRVGGGGEGGGRIDGEASRQQGWQVRSVGIYCRCGQCGERRANRTWGELRLPRRGRAARGAAQRR